MTDRQLMLSGANVSSFHWQKSILGESGDGLKVWEFILRCLPADVWPFSGAVATFQIYEILFFYFQGLWRFFDLQGGGLPAGRLANLRGCRDFPNYQFLFFYFQGLWRLFDLQGGGLISWGGFFHPQFGEYPYFFSFAFLPILLSIENVSHITASLSMDATSSAR